MDEDCDNEDDGVIVIVGVTVAVTDTVEEGEAPIESVGVGVRVGVCEGVGVPVGETVGVGVAVCVAVGEGVTVFDDDGETDAAEEEEGLAVDVAPRSAAAIASAVAS